ncbi:MAG TPA: hypothetical protein VM534_07830, partial [Thermoanaerobaculia bacterium]|nr:hypothetical protein [Thermoanaerobaculia bacterium]
SRKGDFRRIPRLTGEIRHFRGGDSAILRAPEGSSEFREAKLQIWQRHADRIDARTTAAVFERQKQRLISLQNRITESSGRASHLERDLARLEREKLDLLSRIQQEHDAASASAYQLGGKLQQAEASLQVLGRELERTGGELGRAAAEQERLREQLGIRDRMLEEHNEILAARMQEILRLNALLETIYQSRTWKLHQIVEKVRGH